MMGKSWSEEPSELDDVPLDDEEKLAQLILYDLKTESTGVYDFLGLEFQIPPAKHILLNRPSTRVVKQGTVGTFITLVKAFVGIAILTLPYAITHAGYIGGPVALAYLAYLAHNCIQLLLVTSESVRKHGPEAERNTPLSFGKLGFKVGGIWGQRAVDGSLILSQCGFSIGYVIFISENVSQVLCADTRGQFCPSKNTVAFGTVMCLAPFTFLKSMKTLVIPTLLANFALIGGVVWGYTCAFSSGVGRGTELVAFNFSGFPIFFGMGVFAFEGIGLILPIQHVMQEPEKMPTLVYYAMILLTTLFVSFGTLCYLAFGSQTDAMVTANYIPSKVTSFVRLFYALGVFFSFPIMMFPVFQLFESAAKGFLKGPSKGLKTMALRFICVCCSGIIAVSVPHFGLFLGLIGSVCCTLLGYILPAYFHLHRPGRETEDIDHKRSDQTDKGLIIFGIIGGCVSFAITFLEFIQ